MPSAEELRERAGEILLGLAQVLDDAKIRITIPEKSFVQVSQGGVAFIEAFVELPVAP